MVFLPVPGDQSCYHYTAQKWKFQFLIEILNTQFAENEGADSNSYALVGLFCLRTTEKRCPPLETDKRFHETQHPWCIKDSVRRETRRTEHK